MTAPTRYRTIVADPPWPHDEAPMPGQRRKGQAVLPYKTMTIDDIAAIPVRDWADPVGSILFLWTTSRFLWDARDIAHRWGFRSRPVVLAWCKPPFGNSSMGGTFGANLEFVVVARRGSPPPAAGHVPTRWFEWPRTRHSAKPEAFLDMVETTFAGPYLEMFARRARFGWDYWGDQSLGTADVRIDGDRHG